MARTIPKQYTPALSLADVYKTISPKPLMTPKEIDAFYRNDLNKVRGGDKVAPMALGLRRSHGADFYKAFLMGHPGVGKSTELTRLIAKVGDQYRAIRFQVTKELDPGGFKPFDVLLLMMIRVVEETTKAVEDGGAGKSPSDGLLREILHWFAKETATRTEGMKTGIEAAAGIGPPAGSVWHKVLGLFATVKGEIKYASDRSTTVVEYRLQRMSALVDLLNALLTECNELVRDATGREWLFIGEDFDKTNIPARQTEDLFLNNANIFKDLQTHLIFTIPIGPVYSEKGAQLPLPSDCRYIIPDTPVYDRDHKDAKEGRKAIAKILEARVSKDLFTRGQWDRLIVASGGNLRDLFALVAKAADGAFLRGEERAKIDKADVDRAVIDLRTEYERRLGEGPYDVAKVTYEQKAAKLVAIYKQDQAAKIPDPVLYSLLNARAVQEFNGDRWFGVHPLVVDVLQAQKKLIPPEGEGRTVAGGSI